MLMKSDTADRHWLMSAGAAAHSGDAFCREGNPI